MTPSDVFVRIARRVKWWEPPAHTLANEPDFLCRVMAFGTLEDATAVLDAVGPDRMASALKSAAPGILDPRSWHYWHLRLGLGPAGPLPQRRLS